MNTVQAINNTKTGFKATILLVDDEPLILKMLDCFLVSQGYQVLTARGGKFALKIVEQQNQHIDLLITDIRMPDMNGIRLLEAIRQLFPDLPVILMTGYTDFELVVEGLKQHAFDLLAKPIEFEHLNWAISRALAFVMTQRLEQQYRIRLEEQVAKQTKLLCNQLEVLQQAQSKATEVDSLKREFLSLITHEFRTPLNGIMGAIQLMESADSGSDVSSSAYLPILKNSADRMSALVNKLLTLAEASSSNSRQEDQTSTISNTIEILAERYSKKAEKSGIDFKVYCDGESNQHLKGSWDAVQIIASCLLDNALKFTERGDTITCSISFEREEQFKKTGNIKLLIIDTGKGIPLEKQELILQPFTQLEHFLTRSKDGAGIGLAIVRSICDKQGGNLMLESSPETGSSFTCTLPFTISET